MLKHRRAIQHPAILGAHDIVNAAPARHGAFVISHGAAAVGIVAAGTRSPARRIENTILAFLENLRYSQSAMLPDSEPRGTKWVGEGGGRGRWKREEEEEGGRGWRT